MSHHRVGRALGAATAALVVVAGCAPLPATGPRLATGDRPGGGTEQRSDGDPSSPPKWLAPADELPWESCPDRLSGPDLSGPDDGELDCAALSATQLVRLTTSRTPADAPPVVVVAGPGIAAGELAVRLAAAGPEITDDRPVVVLDHRGRSGPAGSCLSTDARFTLQHLADRGADPGDQRARRALADAAQSCTDALAGQELDYDSAAAAEDLEELRRTWGVPGLAVVGVGSGARTALTYASAHPDQVSLVVLDSPAPTGGDQETAARAGLAGSDAALRLWAASCTRQECGPGDAAEKVEAVSGALDRARSPDARVPSALLSDVVRSALGDVAGAAAADAAPGDVILGALAAAGRGETPAPVVSRASELARSSLPYVAGCSDLSSRVAVNRMTELAAEWADTPPFGEVLAAQLSACSTWPVPAPATVELSGHAPVLVLGGVADPVAGAAALEPTAGELTGAGAGDVRTVSWGAPGSRVVLHSACARSAIADFLASPADSERSTACPS